MSTSTHNKKTHYIPEDEVKRLNKITHDEIKMADPSYMMHVLGIVHKCTKPGVEYRFELNGEDHASAYFKLWDDGYWAWKNFARPNEKGSIFDLIKKIKRYPDTNDGFIEAKKFYLQHDTSIVDRAEEAIQYEISKKQILSIEEKQKREKERQIEIEKRREENERLKKENREKAIKNDATSRIINAYPIFNNNENAIEFLKKRGLHQIPPFIMIIKGEKEDRDKQTDDIKMYYQTGIGVLTGDIKKQKHEIEQQRIEIKKAKEQNIEKEFILPRDTAGDIHYFKPLVYPDGKILKTKSFGAKTFSYWFSDENKNKDTVLIFESKFDAAAAYCKNPNIWKEYSGVIANGVNVAPDISIFLNEHGFKKIINYNQNDFPGVLFSYDIIKKLDNFDKKNNYKFIKYNKDEFKQDINDLYKDGKLSDDRFEFSFINQINNFMKINKSLINEKRAKLTNKIDSEIKLIDEKLLRMFKLDKDLTVHLNTKELARFNKLKDGGFSKNPEKRNILENNLGKGIDDLVILFEISQKYDENSKLKQILQNEGVPVMKINGNEDFKKILYAINLKNEDIDDDNLELIEDYIAKNKKDEEVNRILDEWIAYCCENNNKDTIDMAKCFYFSEMECILDRKFKLINIGKNLENSFSNENTATKENITSTENDLIVDETTFLENDNILIDKEEIEYVKAESVSTTNEANISNKEDNTEKVISPSSDNSVDIENRLKTYLQRAKDINQILLSIEEIEPDINTKGFLKDTTNSLIVPINSLWGHMNNKKLVSDISSQPKEKIKELVVIRDEIGLQCKENMNICNKIRNSINEPIQEGKKIDTSSMTDIDFTMYLHEICSKVSSMVEVMKSTLNEIKKNNEIILEQQSQMERTL